MEFMDDNDNYDGYMKLEKYYSPEEQVRASFSEAYKEGYEQGVEKARINAQNCYWTTGTMYWDDAYEYKELDLSSFKKILDQKNIKWKKEFTSGFNDAYAKHWNLMIYKLKTFDFLFLKENQ